MPSPGSDDLRQQQSRARELRRNATGPERSLWRLLRDRRLYGLKFRRQHPIGPFIADFYCHAAQLVIELDGQSHDNKGQEDLRRQHFLEEQGMSVLRIANDDVLRDPEAVLLSIAERAGVDLEAWLHRTRPQNA